MFTVVTNALNIANDLAVRRTIKLVVTGGVARPSSYELIGPLAEPALARLHLDYVVLGVDGFDLTTGATAHHEGEAAVNALMVAPGLDRGGGRRLVQARAQLVRPDLRRRGTVNVLVTDTGADQTLVDAFDRARRPRGQGLRWPIAQVRTATAEDAGVLAKVQLEFWQQAYAEILPTSLLLRTSERIRSRLGGPHRRRRNGAAGRRGRRGGRIRPARGRTRRRRHRRHRGDGGAPAVVPARPRRPSAGHRGIAPAAGRRDRGPVLGARADDSHAGVPRAAGWSQLGSRRVLDTGDGLLTERGYDGDLDLVLV